jgi:hypothetical protein
MLICTSYTSEHFQVNFVPTSIAFCFLKNRDLLNLNFQMINTCRQTLFEIQSLAVYKVGNNILTN